MFLGYTDQESSQIISSQIHFVNHYNGYKILENFHFVGATMS